MEKLIYVLLLAGASFGPLGCGKNLNPSSAASTGGSNVPSYRFGYFFGASAMRSPYGLGLSGNLLWVGNNNTGTYSLQIWGLTGVPVTSIANYDFATYTISSSGQVAAGPDDFVYLADGNNHRVAEFTPEGNYASNFGNSQLGTDYVSAVAVNGSSAYIGDSTGTKIIKYNISGSGLGKTFSAAATFGNTGSGALQSVYALALDGSGRVYVADVFASQIKIFGSNGVFQSAITMSSIGPDVVALDPSGNIYAAAGGWTTIGVFSPSGSPLPPIDTGALVEEGAMAFDTAGNLYVSDVGNNTVAVYLKN